MKKLLPALPVAWAAILLLLTLSLLTLNVPPLQAASIEPPSRAQGALPPQHEIAASAAISVYLPHLSLETAEAPTGEATDETPEEEPVEPTPSTTPTPSPTATDEPPDATPTNTPTNTPTATPTEIPAGEPVGTLQNGGIFYGLNGLQVGALDTSLSQPVSVSVAITDAPPHPMLEGIKPLGSYFHIGTTPTTTTSVQQPLLVALPVPDGADTAHLALAALDPIEERDPNSELTWHFLDGLYDEQHRRFLTTLSYLQPAGRTFVLVEHFSFESPPNGGVAQGASTTIGSFSVACRGFAKPDACTPLDEAQVATYLDQIATRMRDDFDFSIAPRLLNALGEITLDEEQNSLSYQPPLLTTIIPESTPGCGTKYVGKYSAERGMIYLCLFSSGITPATVRTMIHEYFHALQYAYPTVYSTDPQKPSPPPKAWVIEGMANMVEESYYYDDSLVRSVDDGSELYKLDKRLDHSTWGDDDLSEYYAQDFWVYIGQRYLRNLSYLDEVLKKGGATTYDAIIGLEKTFGQRFHDLFWGFAKNQAIENTYDLGDEVGAVCEYNPLAFSGDNVRIWHYHSANYWHYPKNDPEDTIQPLSSKLIEIIFPEELGHAYTTVELSACKNYYGEDWEECMIAEQKHLHAKFYIEAEPNCSQYVDYIDGLRDFDLTQPGARYYVLLTNTDPYGPHSYSITIEASLKPK